MIVGMIDGNDSCQEHFKCAWYVCGGGSQKRTCTHKGEGEVLISALTYLRTLWKTPS